MKILTLTLKNFRLHQATVLELDRFSFVRGPNGCGICRDCCADDFVKETADQLAALFVDIRDRTSG